jgi:hypothetical protein
VRVSRRKKLIKLYEVSITTGPPGDFVGPDDVVSTENTQQQVASYLNEIQDEPFKTKMTPSLQFLKEQITQISSNVQIFNKVSLSNFKILHQSSNFKFLDQTLPRIFGSNCEPLC